MTELVNVTEQIGIVTFAFSGLAAGIEAMMDVFGLMVLDFITTLRAGFIQDVLLNNAPVAFTNNHYFLVALISTGFTMTLLPLNVTIRNSVIHTADVIGSFIGGSVTWLLNPFDLQLGVLAKAICAAVIVWIGHKGWIFVPTLR
ncbi:MAG: TRIC cation channel family protein [Dehalococcoidia bacterium]|nr:TRIC cation channel family protein [Dehalococcoidia bacterium]